MTLPAAFLDRDGTLIQDPGFLSDPEGVVLIPGVVEALRLLESWGWARVVVTNQSGIGHGYYTEADYQAVTARMLELLDQEGVSLTAVYHCPHQPDSGCTCRKPGTALHREGAARWDLDLTRSWCIGDRPGDLLAAAPLRASAALVLTGAGERHREWAENQGFPVHPNLLEVVLREIGGHPAPSPTKRRDILC